MKIHRTIFGQICLALTALIWLLGGLALCQGKSVAMTTSHSGLDSPAPPQIDFTPAGSQLTIAGKVVLTTPDAHMGQPQISPDGRILAVEVLPRGNETQALAHIHLLALPSGAPLTILPGHTPTWGDSSMVHFVRGGQRKSYDPARNREHSLGFLPAAPVSGRAQPITIAYPATIRVIHHASNSCRSDVPVGQIDLIPFEEYVARVVPWEVPASWPLPAVAAQAIAARTYGWYQIRQGRPDYDVSDWANYQVMCDDRDPASDAAVAATAGLALSARSGEPYTPLLAMFSAENGHPTRSNPVVDYLQAVPDLPALGQERFGHGYGLSQWGAYRRARMGHSYCQILGHYYTDTYLFNGLNPDQPVGCLPVLADQAPFAPPGGLYWAALTQPDPLTPTLVIASSQPLTRSTVVTVTEISTETGIITDTEGMTSTVLITHTLLITQSQLLTGPISLSGVSGVWIPPVLLNEGSLLTASLWLSHTLQDQVQLVVDNHPPLPPEMSLPQIIYNTALPVTITAQAGDLVSLGADWVWEGEALFHTTESGTVISDSAALNGEAWAGSADTHQPGVWYGPYTQVLPAGRSYRALFYLRTGQPSSQIEISRTGQNQTGGPLARLDVTDQGGEVLLGLRDIQMTDFDLFDGYTKIPVDFHLFEPAQGIELRTAWQGVGDLALDRVEIWSLPSPGWRTGPLFWTLPYQEGVHPVLARAFDPAGNASAVVTDSVQATDESPPRFGADFAPTGWQRTLPLEISQSISDELSGLDPHSARILVAGEEQSASLTLSGPAAGQIHTTLTALPQGESGIQFSAQDLATHLAQSAVTPVYLDSNPPVATQSLSTTGPITTTGDRVWYLAPVTVTLQADDSTSGLAEIRYGLAGSPDQPYTQPLVLDQDGHYTVTYQAWDVAGNQSPEHSFTLGLDLTPPTLILTLTEELPGTGIARWQAADRGAGIAGFQGELRRGVDPWTQFTPDATGQMSFTLTAGEAFRLRMRSVDRVGRTSPWVEALVISAAQRLYLPLIKRIPQEKEGANRLAFTGWAPTRIQSQIPSSPLTVQLNEPLTIPAKLAIYYGWPSLVNGANGDINQAVAEFLPFDMIVLGDGLEHPAHGDHGPTSQIISQLTAAGREVYGYVDMGVSTQNLSLATAQHYVEEWAAMGVTGIFWDDAGYDFGVDRNRQNVLIDTTHGQGLKAFVNAWNPDDVLAADPDPTHLAPGDLYLAESHPVANGAFADLAFWWAKSQTMALYRQQTGVRMAAISTGSDGAVGWPNQPQFRQSLWAAYLFGWDALGFTNNLYSSSGSGANRLRDLPQVATQPGTLFTGLPSGPTGSPPTYARTTNQGTISVWGQPGSGGGTFRGGDCNPGGTSGWIWPTCVTVPPAQSSPFGPRQKASESFRYDWHRGVDIPIPLGSPLYAVADGLVRVAGIHPAYSDPLVQIRHGAATPYTYSNYLHMNSWSVAEGDLVTQGELVGASGESVSEFDHLHLEVRQECLFQDCNRNPWGYFPYTDQPPGMAELWGANQDSGQTLLVLDGSTPADQLDLDGIQVNWGAAQPRISFDGLTGTTDRDAPHLMDDPVVHLDGGVTGCIFPGRFSTSHAAATYRFALAGLDPGPTQGSAALWDLHTAGPTTAITLTPSPVSLTPLVTAGEVAPGAVHQAHFTLHNGGNGSLPITLTVQSAQGLAATVAPQNGVLAPGTDLGIVVSAPLDPTFSVGVGECVLLAVDTGGGTPLIGLVLVETSANPPPATPTATATRTRTPIPTGTATPTPSVTPGATRTPTVTAASTSTATATRTPTPTGTATPTPSATPSATPAAWLYLPGLAR